MQINLDNKSEDTYIIHLDEKNYIQFCPERGGLITDWVCDSEPILYFDKSRFLDKTKSIRGGIPILFPICGSLNTHESIFGKDLELLPQHGFARNLRWEYEHNKQRDCLTLLLEENLTTKKYYPYEFSVKIDVILRTHNLDLEITIKNKSNKFMPINFGLHPYFNISDFKNIAFSDYPLICQNQSNNTLEKTLGLLPNIDQGIDMLVYSSGRSSFRDYGLHREITVSHPFPFDINVIWSDPPRKMVCMEPWTSPRNSLKEGFRRIEIPPYALQRLFTSINIKKFD